MIYVHGDGERVRSPLDVPAAVSNVVPFVSVPPQADSLAHAVAA